MSEQWLQYRPNPEIFDPSKFEWAQDNGKLYFQVAGRVLVAHFDAERWAQEHDSPEILSIQTEIVRWDDQRLVMKATVTTYKGVFTGYSSLRWDSENEIESGFPIEVCETSAVGRALAFAGYGILHGIASAEEMLRVPSVASEVNRELIEKAKQELAQRAAQINVNPVLNRPANAPAQTAQATANAPIAKPQPVQTPQPQQVSQVNQRPQRFAAPQVNTQTSAPTNVPVRQQSSGQSAPASSPEQPRVIQRRRRSLMMAQANNSGGNGNPSAQTATSNGFPIYDKNGNVIAVLDRIDQNRNYEGKDAEPATEQQRKSIRAAISILGEDYPDVDQDRLYKEMLAQVGASSLEELKIGDMKKISIKLMDIANALKAKYRSQSGK